MRLITLVGGRREEGEGGLTTIGMIEHSETPLTNHEWRERESARLEEWLGSYVCYVAVLH